MLSRGFNALLKNAVPFLAVALLLAGIPSFVAQYWLLGIEFDNPALEFLLSWQFWGPILGGVLIGFVANAVLQGTLIGATVQHLGGRQVQIGQSVATALARALSIIILSLIVALCVGFGLLALIVPGVILYLMFSVAVPAMVAERRGIFDSMSRSASLTKGSRSMILLLVFILLVFGGAVSAVFSSLFTRLAASFGDAAADRIILSLGGMIGDMIVAALGAVMIASLYVELRALKEGASADIIADVFS
ncbi:MAG: YciC family protein [Sphingomonas sp.]